MKVLCTNAQDILKIDESQVERLVESFLSWKKVECDEVTIHFVDKEKITSLHALHFDDPTPTDCISFPLDAPQEEGSGYKILGEIFVCPEVALEYSQKHNLSPQRELSLYIVHGLLHLLGFDDRDRSSEPIMRDEEKSAISYLEQKEKILNG
ncbi:MAG: Endoribonuclease YbeY [Chlamydiae bacterium]|nr:Endoribonuclease YbeY [Chlamydiota bacterium]